MTYLLDTNVLIFLFSKEYNRLSKNQLAILNNKGNNYLLSQASYYEMAIKLRLGKLDFTLSDMEEFRRQLSIRMLNLETLHFSMIDSVPKVKDEKGKPHGDPFDLLILAQAQYEELPVLSTDRHFPKYTTVTVIS
jgi:PIN domain nuclease of toxin-antitoxin system